MSTVVSIITTILPWVGILPFVGFATAGLIVSIHNDREDES